MRKWVVILPITVVLAASIWMTYELYRPFHGYTGKIVVVVNSGMHVQNVADELVDHGVLAYRLPFLFRCWWGRTRHETLKYGEYLFDRPLSASNVYEKIVRGEVYLHSVVIPEGSDRFDMARIYAREIGLDPRAFLAASRSASSIHDLDPHAPTLEGYLFPDTYRFPRGEAASRVIQRMVDRFRHVWRSQIVSRTGHAAGSVHEVITLASLVEKETPSPEERSLIAGVFTRRLRLGMPLQCDPTIIYAIRLMRGAADTPITGGDLQVESPYNTYSHAGLPPGPICSPGLASIIAALHPAPGKALYFVSNNHGGHVFANTLAEQNRNVAHYRNQLKAACEQQQGQRLTRVGGHSRVH
jgi:UPF0755 protein